MTACQWTITIIGGLSVVMIGIAIVGGTIADKVEKERARRWPAPTNT